MTYEKSLNIAMLSAHSCPLGRLGAKDTGGMSVYIVELARELGKHGHHVDVYTRVHDPREPLIRSLGENARLIHLSAGKNEEIHKLAVYPHLPTFASRLEHFRCEEDITYDLIHSHYWLSAWAGHFLQEWWDVPHVTMFHTVGAIKNTLGIGGTEPDLRLRTEKEIARTCQRITVSTAQEKNELIRHYGIQPGNISVIPCGVNLTMFHPVEKMLARCMAGFSNQEKHILFACRIEPLKGVDKLVTALALIRKECNARLWIIGGDKRSRAEVERLKKLSRELSLEDRITFAGLVKHEELYRYYSAADVCIVPSYYESFGLVLLESLACGTPVVATDVGAARDIIRQGKTGYVVPTNNPGILARRIVQVLNKAETTVESVNATRASVARYSWEQTAVMTEAEYHAVIDGYKAGKRQLTTSTVER